MRAGGLERSDARSVVATDYYSVANKFVALLLAAHHPRYLLTSYSRFLIHYHSLSRHSRHYYELIPQGKGVRVHMDVERKLGGLGKGARRRGEGDIVKVLRGEFWR